MQAPMLCRRIARGSRHRFGDRPRGMPQHSTRITTMVISKDSFGARSMLHVGDRTFEIFRLDALRAAGHDVARLPYSLRILLENLLRQEDGVSVTADDIRTLADWHGGNGRSGEIAFMPARVLMQDFTGVPAIVDLAAMRDAMRDMGGEASRINPLLPVELVIDHSMQVD